MQRGVDVDDHSTDNTAGIAACTRHLEEMHGGLLFANLVDVDQVWGHRNDVAGYAANLERFDARLASLPPRLLPSDLPLSTAAHGNDPPTPDTYQSTHYDPSPLQPPSATLVPYPSPPHPYPAVDLNPTPLSPRALRKTNEP